MQMYKKKAKPTIYNAIKMKNVFFRQIYGHENEMYNVGVSLKEVECL